MTDTKRSHEAIADDLEERGEATLEYWCGSDKEARAYATLSEVIESRLMLEAAEALREPIKVTDAMAIRGKMASRDVYVGISDVRRIIEAALKVRSEE